MFEREHPFAALMAAALAGAITGAAATALVIWHYLSTWLSLPLL
jgi:hypothetical protein